MANVRCLWCIYQLGFQVSRMCMGETEAQCDPGSNEEMMLSLQRWSNLRPWAAGPQPLQQESESAQAQVTPDPQVSSLVGSTVVQGRDTGQSPPIPGLSPQTLCCLSVNHFGYCPEVLSTMPKGHPEDHPPDSHSGTNKQRFGQTS